MWPVHTAVSRGLGSSAGGLYPGPLGVLLGWCLASPRRSDQEQVQGEPQAFHSLVSEVASRHFLLIFYAGSKSLKPREGG